MLLEVRSAKSNKISLTPLIDVVFILLLFFMLSSSFSHWFSIDISMAQGAKSKQLETARVQLLNQQGMVIYDGKRFSLDDLKLGKALDADKKRAVFIDVESSVNTQTIVKLISLLNKQGVQKVSLGDVFMKPHIRTEAL